MQVACNLTDQVDGCLKDKSHLIIDRDAKYTARFRRLITESRIAVIRLPLRSPNLNAFAERFVRSIKEECLDRMIFIGQAALRRTVSEFVIHYHHERNHQGLGNRLIQQREQRPLAAATSVSRRQRLGGMLSFYYLAVAQPSAEILDTTTVAACVRVRSDRQGRQAGAGQDKQGQSTAPCICSDDHPGLSCPTAAGMSAAPFLSNRDRGVLECASIRLREQSTQDFVNRDFRLWHCLR